MGVEMVGGFSRRGYDFILGVLTLFLIVFGTGCGGHTAGTNPPVKVLNVQTIALNSNGVPVANLEVTNSFGESVLTDASGEALLTAEFGSELLFTKDGLTTSTLVTPNDPNSDTIIYAVQVNDDEIIVVEQVDLPDSSSKKNKGKGEQDPLVDSAQQSSGGDDSKGPNDKGQPQPTATPTPEPTPDTAPEPEFLALITGTLPPTLNDQAGTDATAVISLNGVRRTVDQGQQFSMDGIPVLLNSKVAYFVGELMLQGHRYHFRTSVPLNFNFEEQFIELNFNFVEGELDFLQRIHRKDGPIQDDSNSIHPDLDVAAPAPVGVPANDSSDDQDNSAAETPTNADGIHNF